MTLAAPEKGAAPSLAAIGYGHGGLNRPPCWTRCAPASTGLGHRASDVPHQVGLLPGEAAVLVGRTAEMAVGGGAPVDRPVELERAADVGRREPEDFR